MASYGKFDTWKNNSGVARESIVQVKQEFYTSGWVTSTHGGPGTGPASSGTVTPLSVTITPKYPNSRILVTSFGVPMYYTGYQVWLGSLYRMDSSGYTYQPGQSLSGAPNWATCIYAGTAGVTPATTMMSQYELHWTDSPATTKSITYGLKISGNNSSATGPVGIGYSEQNWRSYGGTCSITVMEIMG